MRDYTEFKYHKHFFESERLLNNLIIQMFSEFSWRYYKCSDVALLDNEFLDVANSVFLDISEEEYKSEKSSKYQTLNYEIQGEIIQSKNFFLKVSSFMEYLFVEFQHSTHNVYKETESRNKDYVFKNLLKAIEESTDYYNSLLNNFNINKLQRIIIQNLIEENQRKLELVKREFSDLVPYVHNYFTTSLSTQKANIKLEQQQQQNFHNIFISKDAEIWFIHAMGQLNWLNQFDERGFQAKVLSFFDVDECRKNIFKRTVYKKDFVGFLNLYYEKEVIKPAKNYSKSDNAQIDLKRHISAFPFPI
ncbi:hypothetical protein [Chryseobacterium sp. BIGb0232]|uniref:hypothetical protein n=1 Tax=Chryseobacterium sp. BIGb0232 TaxID=2940598 RepID=UPI000F478E86|nr:hypothetical protein [Chryseobacterium sp. BIGb0232]MCS4301824.1 hypothetical protein [Chryseobacterium sp. BIGb0232]ROS19324.1 hypothetical protein EDF65_0007 [Chryseobacterium nakagawai]